MFGIVNIFIDDKRFASRVGSVSSEKHTQFQTNGYQKQTRNRCAHIKLKELSQRERERERERQRERQREEKRREEKSREEAGH